MKIIKNNKILIVEDSPTQAAKLKYTLEINGYNVDSAENGKKALEYIHNNKPSLIISDIVMPEMDGFALCDIIKKDESLKKIPIVLLTTLSETEHIIHALEVGADYFLTKPCDEEFLLSRVALFLRVQKEEVVEEYQLAYQTQEGKLNVFTSGKKQMVTLLISTYENAVEQNKILLKTQENLEKLNEHLNEKVIERTAKLSEEIIIRKNAEEKIRQSQLRFKSVIESANDAILIGDSEGKIIIWNKAAETIFGYTPDQIVNQSISILMPEDFREKYMLEYSLFIKTHKPTLIGETIEVEGIRKNGSIFPISISLSHWEADDTIYFSAIIKDISKQRAAVDALKKSELEFRTVWESSASGMRITDENGIVFKVNTAYAKIFKKSINELEGKLLSEVYSEKESEHIQQSHKEKFAEKTIKNNFDRKLTLWNDDEIWVHVANSYLEFGESTLLLSIFTDITKQKVIEEKLKKAESQFRKLFEEDLTGDFITTLDGKIILCNPTFAKILGYESVDEVLKHNVSEFYPNLEKREALINLVLQNGTVEYYEQQMVRADGKRIDVIENVIGTFDEEGKIIEIKGYMFDQSSRKKAERRQLLTNKILTILNRPNEWQQLIKDILSEVKLFTGFEAIGIRLKEGNDFPYFESVGFPAHFVKMENSLCAKDRSGNMIVDENGKPILECMCGNIICRRTDSSKSFFTEGGSFWSNNTTNLLASTTEEDRQAHTRNRCNGEGYESVALIPLKSGDNVIGLIQFNDKRPNMFEKDLIEFFEGIGSTIGIAYRRVQDELRIKASERQFRSIYENSAHGIFRSSCDGKILMANPALYLMLGYSSEYELTKNMNFPELYVNVGRYDDFKEIIKKEEIIYGFECKWKKADGAVIWVRQNAKAIRVEKGILEYIEGTIEDITEKARMIEDLVKAKDAAEEMNKLKNIFLANMSHELRTPLVGIIGYAEILMNEVENMDQKEIADFIVQCGGRLSETLNQILDLSVIEAEKVEINLTELDLIPILKQTKKLFEGVAHKKNLSLILKTENEKVFGLVDEQLLEKVINNLINNAIKFTNVGGVTLSIKQVDDEIIIEIEDTGIGIAPENTEIIFEPFRQADEGLSRTFEGTGLGLTLTKKFVKLLKGSIKVESELGRGSRFTLIVKAGNELNSKNNIIEHKIAENNNKLTALQNTKKHLLMVEDEAINADVIIRALKDKYIIDWVKTPEEGIQKGTSQKYSVIFMDIGLKGLLSGLDVVQKIIENDINKSTPIIAITAYAMKGDKEKFMASGCTHYLAKPFTLNALSNLLGTIFKE